MDEGEAARKRDRVMYKALVVDDSRTAQKMLGTVLKKQSILVEFAGSGEDALKQLGTFHPDIIFLDHMMPGMDGFQTLQQIKLNEATRDIPVVMFTSQNAQKYADEARALGASGVISKQVSSPVIANLIETLVASRESKRPAPVQIAEVKLEEVLQETEKARFDLVPMAELAELEQRLKLQLEKITSELRAANENEFRQFQAELAKTRAASRASLRKIVKVAVGVALLSFVVILSGYEQLTRHIETQSVLLQQMVDTTREVTTQRPTMGAVVPQPRVEQSLLDGLHKKLAGIEATLLENQMTLRDIQEVQEARQSAAPDAKPAPARSPTEPLRE